MFLLHSSSHWMVCRKEKRNSNFLIPTDPYKVEVVNSSLTMRSGHNDTRVVISILVKVGVSLWMLVYSVTCTTHAGTKVQSSKN